MPRTTRSMTIRRSGMGDLGSLSLLAALDSAPLPAEPLLIAESEGRMVAAVPLDGGAPVADPFEPTAEIVALLELRARQIRAVEVAGHARPGLFRRLRALLA